MATFCESSNPFIVNTNVGEYRGERMPTRCNNIDDLLSIQMLIIDYSLDM